MRSKPSNREEEFELVLGNKQLLSLFFIVVGFFAAFFSVGYMVGFGHGEKTSETSGMAQVEEPAPPPPEPRLPATLMQDPPGPPPTTAAVEQPKPSPAAEPTPAPKPVQQAAVPSKPIQTAPAKGSNASPKPSPTTAAPAAAKPKPTPPPSAPAAAPAATAGNYVLQVAALRVQADADQLAGKLKAKGYPATVNAGQGDGWQRVVVGPFSSAEAAKSFKTKLTQDGFDTMLRKL